LTVFEGPVRNTDSPRSGTYMQFLRTFLETPEATGAIAPSSAELCLRMTEWLELETATAIAEFGPGTGAFTEAILTRLPAHARFLGIEISPRFAAIMRKRFSRVQVYEADVRELGEICRVAETGPLDCIISGLPWATFSDQKQREVLAAGLLALKPGGQFVTFGYLQGLVMPGGQRLGRLLTESFASVSRTETVWRNLPPAVVYRCRKAWGK